VLPRDSEGVEGRETRGLAPRFHAKLCAKAADKFCTTALDRKHPSQKKQIARLHRFDKGTGVPSTYSITR
jgi:hypothetical protein